MLLPVLGMAGIAPPPLPPPPPPPLGEEPPPPPPLEDELPPPRSESKVDESESVPLVLGVVPEGPEST